MIEAHPLTVLITISIVVYLIGIRVAYCRTWGESKKVKNKYKDKR